MKKWFLERFLPMWAKQTVYRDNRALARNVQKLQQENDTLRSYIKGLHRGLRAKEVL